MEEVYIPFSSQRTLLSLARETLEDFVRKQARRSEPVLDPYLQARHGVFVSLHANEELRGCLGTVTGEAPLCEAVIELTEAAASRDGRVKPVRASELSRIHIQISVLSRLRSAVEPLSLQIGRHGLHVSQHLRRGVLLPQVAVEYGWDIKTFLEQACLKAGLDRDAWQHPASRISSFEALMIEE